jgi:hypothetical protein
MRVCSLWLDLTEFGFDDFQSVPAIAARGVLAHATAPVVRGVTPTAGINDAALSLAAWARHETTWRAARRSLSRARPDVGKALTPACGPGIRASMRP